VYTSPGHVEQSSAAAAYSDLYGLTSLHKSANPYLQIYGFAGNRIYAFTCLQKSVYAHIRFYRKP